VSSTRARTVQLAAAAVVVLAAIGTSASAAAQPAPPPPTATTVATTAPTAPSPPGIGLGPGAPVPSTTIAPPAGASGPAGGGEDNPGFFDIGGRIRKAINDWFRDLVTSAVDPVLDLLGRTVLATPEVSGTERVRDLWRVSAGIANGFFVIFIVIGGAVVMSHETLQTRYSAKEIAPRLVVGAIAANTSLAVAGLAIDVANAFSRAFLGQGVDPVNATGAMRVLVLGPLTSGGIFFVLVGLVAAVLGLVLLAVYIVRVALVVVLVGGAPVALACHALPQTEGLAQLWWRAFAACLGIQVAQSLVLVTALRVFFASDGRATLGLSAGGSLVDLLIVVCLLWMLLRIPTWAGRMVFSGRGSSTARLVRNVVIYKAIRAMGKAAAA
jgi:hypothetical protein